MLTPKKVRWSWKAWLARLEEARVDEAVKEVGRRFAAASRKRGHRCWVAAYEVEGAWEPGNKVLASLHAIRRQNLVWHNQGSFYPFLGPRPPQPGAYRLRPAELSLLRRMLTEYGGRGLYHVNRHGYIDRPTDKARWRLRLDFPASGVRPPDRIIPARLVNALGRRGMLESNGCGHGWPFQWTSEFRIATHCLYAVFNLPDDLRRFQTEN